MYRDVLIGLVVAGTAAVAISCGGGGGIGEGSAPTLAPRLDGEVTRANAASHVTSQSDDDLYVRIVVTNPNPSGTDVSVIRYCLKFDPNEDEPLTATEAQSYLDPIPNTLPENVDVKTVAYQNSPQIIEIRDFKGAALSPNERYWVSAVFVSSNGEAGPATTPQRFKLIFRYQLVEPPEIGILKDFQGTVKAHTGDVLPNAFVQYFHEGVFLEATVTEDDGTYYMEVVVPNPTGTSSVKEACCEESDDPTDYILKVYHPYYSDEVVKYLLPEYVHYYVDFQFEADRHQQGSGGTL
jgi:hypothetical protein